MLKILVTGGCKFENCDLVIKRENEFQKRVGKFIVPIPEPLMVDSLAQVEMR